MWTLGILPTLTIYMPPADYLFLDDDLATSPDAVNQAFLSPFNARVNRFNNLMLDKIQDREQTYLKNGKRWAKFPYLAPQYLPSVSSSMHSHSSPDPGQTQQASPQTPVSTKRSLRDLWDRSDIDDINTAEGPSPIGYTSPNAG
ncbi:hypothetical protein V8E54_010010 [Elaphomyces granulatus]